MNLHVGERIIYGFLDLMGDVGGFFDALRIIAMFLLSMASFQPLNTFLARHLFKIKPDGKDGEPCEMQDMDELKLGWCSLAKLNIL